MSKKKEKRHRIYEDEIPGIQEGLRLLLYKLHESREHKEMAEAACRVLFRLHKKDPGRPKYPKLTWDTLTYFAEFHT